MNMRVLARSVAAGLLLLAAACATIGPPPDPPQRQRQRQTQTQTQTQPQPQPQPQTEAAPAQAGSRPEPPLQPPVPQSAHYACDDGSTVSARFADDTLTLSGLAQGEQTLLRDAGGVTPEQTVWSNDHVRAEFGLPPDGAAAVLHLLEPQPATLHCLRQ